MPAATPAAAAAPAAKDSAATEDANEYVQRASALYDEGKIELALAEYRRGISHDPMDPDTWYGLAETLHALGREKQALDTYALALTMIVHAPELRAPYAELLVANKKRDEAIKVLQKGIELDPDADALKAMLGATAVMSLDDTSAAAASVAAAPATALKPSTAKATPAAPGAKKAPVKRKKLCKLFCNVAKPK